MNIKKGTKRYLFIFYQNLQKNIEMIKKEDRECNETKLSQGS